MIRATVLAVAMSGVAIAGATGRGYQPPSARQAAQQSTATPPARQTEEDIRKNKKLRNPLWGTLMLSLDAPCVRPSCIVQVDTTALAPFGPPPNTREIKVEISSHQLTLVVNSVSANQQFEIKPEDRTIIALNVPTTATVPVSAAPKDGTLTVVVDRASKVKIGDKVHDIKAPEDTLTLPFGEYNVQLQSADAKAFKVTISADRPSAVIVFSAPPPLAPAAPPPLGGEIHWVTVNGGSMQLGCVGPQDSQCQPDERPRVANISSFKMMATEVTVGQFEEWLKDRNALSGYERPEWTALIPVAELPLHPAVRVKWADAQAFCQDQHGRLPREDEWEFAARQSRRDGIYAWDAEWDSYVIGDSRLARGRGGRDARSIVPVNIADESGAAANPTWKQFVAGYDDRFPYTAPVRSTQAIKGIYDLVGNVWEWMEDDFLGKPGRKVLRGGSFSSPPVTLRVSHRASLDGKEQREDVGFRCVMPPR